VGSSIVKTEKFQSTPPRGRRPKRQRPTSARLLFQSTPPRGRRLEDSDLDGAVVKFQSTPPRGRRLLDADMRRGLCSFNPRPRAGGDGLYVRRLVRVDLFQSTPPRGRRHATSRRRSSVDGFNPRPRAGGDELLARLDSGLKVSIHAPAREATRIWRTGESWRWSFNPRPRAGGDLERSENAGWLFVFQSTPPRGRRLAGGSDADHDALVSIHAPAREATARRCRILSDIMVSIHAPAREATLRPQDGTLAGQVSIHAPAREATPIPTAADTANTFQSTPPRGRRPDDLGRQAVGIGFNPRPRAGGDGRGPERLRAGDVSIHAPAREATSTASMTPPGPSCFNPRPRAGGDRRRRDDHSLRSRFQSTPPRGRRPWRGGRERGRPGVSIHAPAREATDSGRRLGDPGSVSIHAPAREATP